ncbi:MAG: response regulator, partial [Chitinivibrionales bacterium]|nr:response regulator [Chitinivibrionales bacterium]
FISTALLIFTCILSYIVARRFTSAYAASEQLSRELKEANTALSRMDAVKDQFLANTSHELRTPLTGIIGIAESLPDAYPETPEEVRRNLGTIAASGRRLSALVNDILDFSRLKNHDIRLDTRAVHLAPLVRTVTTVLAPLVRDKPVALRIDKDAVDRWVMADEDRLQQVLYNLIGNAAKFTDEGSVTVTARPDGDMVSVSVVDTGPGIAPELRESIFEPFERAAADHTARPGTGLGLGIARHLVELHGGALSLESEPGKGSTFSFSVPRAEEPTDTTPRGDARLTPIAEEVMLRGSDPHATPVTLPRRVSKAALATVLVVDDEPVNLQVAVNQLTAAGYGVRTCDNGEAALKHIDCRPTPDLVLLDLMMPGMSGYEVCERARSRFGQAELPIIIVTARNRISDLVRGFSAGANDYIAKPYSRDELLARVRTQLQLKTAFAALDENHRLREELQRRVRREQHLRMLQRRLAEALDKVPLSVCAIDESGVVLFANEPAGNLLGKSPRLLSGTPVDSLITPVSPDGPAAEPLSSRCVALDAGARLELDVTIRQGDGQAGPRTMHAMPLSLDDEDITVLLFHARDTVPVDENTVGLFVDELNRNKQRLERLERSLHRLASGDPAALDPIRNELQAIDTMLAQMGTHLQPPDTPADRRTAAREIMTLALAYWEESTGESRLVLARESGLWRIEVSPDGFERARTLDRYLDARTFPKVPRWKKVLQTGDFVLARCPDSTDTRQKLEIALSRLRLT